ncbi:GntR family transcriptional regulator [Mycobacterium kansasii]|uniref:Mannosyl-D-glycerate transport/metabolism system repressor MngR n=1 Tax=Mycobacterium innocens TaxID=2341083 RepID=A0A498Q8A4_9MYCO|nr:MULTISPECIES: GntR family transcriptional regulator [Mycobacterium]KZS67279.1 GntR family transcriptional regulator [Mycobacterium kansasii]VBA41531.1 Mannosyl-D-glycerate transport/metabolism system repressor MngR [Mycobacterium innocens]
MGTVHQAGGKTAPVSACAGVPLHRQLFLVLHDEIERGVLAPGDALPTEQALCEQFAVSRITVRRALADLAEQGYIQRRHGVGSFVREEVPADRSAPGRSYLEGLRQTQFETEAEIIELGVRRPPRAVARALQTTGELLHVVRLRRQRRTGEPLIVSDVWLPAELAGTLTESALRKAPLYELVKRTGAVVDRVQHEITAEIAGPRNAQLLETAIGAALLRINRLIFAAGMPHHYQSVLVSPTRSRLLLTQSSDELEAADGLAIAHDVRREPT